MQIVLDYVTGKISSDEFKNAWEKNPEIGMWLDQLIDLKSPLPPEWDSAPYSGFRKAIHKYYDGSMLKFLAASEQFDSKNAPRWLDIGWNFETVTSIIVIAYPEIQPTDFYEKEKAFYINAVGDYFGGPEVEACIGSVLDQFPHTMRVTARKKEGKAAIRALFHVEGAKYPCWAQEPEWPMGANSPMKFISQRRSGDAVQYLFQDVDTGEERTVVQYY